MYAVIASGGKQYRVEQGQVLSLEKLPQEVGDSINFDQVLMVADGESLSVGAPLVSNAKVTAEVLSQERGDKVEIIKFRRRKHHMKRQGHRQYLTKVKITEISADGMKSTAKAESKAKAEPKAAAEPTAKAAPKKAAKPTAQSKAKADAKPKATKAKKSEE